MFIEVNIPVGDRLFSRNEKIIINTDQIAFFKDDGGKGTRLMMCGGDDWENTDYPYSEFKLLVGVALPPPPSDL